MELTQLHYFVAVARTENITKAAQELFISQPALSRVIARLERELGTPLFDRHGGRVTLNEQGKVFLTYIQPALDSINNGVHAVIDGLGSREILIHNYLISDLFKSIVEKCQAQFPNMTFTVKNIGDNAGDDALAGEEPDIVMLPTKQFRNYIFHMTYMERWCVMYNSRYQFRSGFNGCSLTLEQLAQEPVAFAGSHYDRMFLEQIFSEAGLAPKLVLCSSLAESSAQINRCKCVGFTPMTNFRTLIHSIDSIPICAASISDVPCQRMLYLGRSPKFLSNEDEYKVLESIKNYLSNEYAETDAFYESYFGE